MHRTTLMFMSIVQYTQHAYMQESIAVVAVAGCEMHRIGIFSNLVCTL